MCTPTKPQKAKNFVKKHKVAIGLGALAVTVIAIQARGNHEHNKFLVAKGLFDEYYFVPEDEDN